VSGREPAASDVPERVRAGAFSALLEELVRAPAEGDRPALDTALRPGAVVERFELVRELGRGGFGVVFEARDRVLGRSVAFKAVTLRADRPGVEVRVLQEAEAAARLTHPNIVTLYDVGRSEHGPYLVLELLHGRTLAERLEQGPMPLREAVRVAVEAAKGLAHAHASGVVHRDLTPGNVFLCDDGQVKLLDLGMAHAFGHRKRDGGTPAYMAPEQWRGAPEDERTDVFALGTVLHRMLAGESPWRAEGAGADARPAPALDVPDAPALGTLVGRMLERDPVRRPRDAGEVLAALRSVQQELERAPAANGGVRVRRRRGPWRLMVLVAVGAIAGAVVAGVVTQRRAAREAAAAAPSIAVLPFADLSPQRDQEYFSDGLAEEILNALAQVDGLHVAGRSSSFSFKGKDEDLRAIGQRLHVSNVLEGSVRKEGNRVRITAEVVKVGDGYHLWSQSFDRELTGIFAIQDEIARAVVAALKVRLLPGQEPATRRPTTNPEVFNQYLLGRQFMRRLNEPDYTRAVAAYRGALALDPAYAPAWAGLAEALFWISDTAPTQRQVSEGYDQAVAAADRAVELDPELADGYAMRGFLRGVLRWNFEGARADFERALALKPGHADTHRLYAAVVLAPVGRLTDAIGMMRKAVELDPLAAVTWANLGRFYFCNGDQANAEAALLRSLEIAPEQNYAPIHLATLQMAQGKPTQALVTAERSTSELFRLMLRAMALHDLGDDAASRRTMDDMIARFGHNAAYQIAAAFAWRGERDRALEWLERAYAQHDSGLPWLNADVPFQKLHGEPRFEAIVRKMGLAPR
jgi:TolB-like protein/Tfp pilus assembly protein PilF